MSNPGRGRNYSAHRARVEWLCTQLFRGGWARALADLHPGSNHVEVTRYSVAVPSWPAGVAPVRALLLSDLHAGPTTSRAVLRSAFDAAERARPDLVLLGGDYVFLDAAYISELAPGIASLRPRLGTFAVMGNHDLWADDARIVRTLESAGARVLVNESAQAGPLSVVGFDDPWTGHPDAAQAFRGVDTTRPVVVLGHSPDALLFFDAHRFDVLVSGHTHGGHVCLPGGIPVAIPSRLGRRYAQGRHDLDRGGALIIGRGIGAVESPLRAWAQPQVVVVELGPFTNL